MRYPINCELIKIKNKIEFLLSENFFFRNKNSKKTNTNNGDIPLKKLKRFKILNSLGIDGGLLIDEIKNINKKAP